MLYDADKIDAAASAEKTTDLYDAQLDVFLDPNDPVVIETARADGIPEDWIQAAQESPIWKMAMEWKVAFLASRNDVFAGLLWRRMAAFRRFH